MRQFFKNLFGKGNSSKPIAGSRNQFRRLGVTLRKKVPRGFKDIKFDPKNIRLETVTEHSAKLRLGLVVFGVFLASGIASRLVSVWLRPTYTPLPNKKTSFMKPPAPKEDYSTIEQRNIFDVENKIPDPYDPVLLDCLSQAKPSTQRLSLLGTIVMTDDKLSVALLQEDGNANKTAVKKDETFFDKYQAMKIERKKLCFQVKATQEFEFIEIPEEGGDLSIASGPILTGRVSDGIVPQSENKFTVKQGFLDAQLKDLNNVLQTAKAVPYQDPGTGKMRGFLIQSIEGDSPFASLGLKQGDVLTGVNDIVLDNAGKGLEAFNRLRNSNQITLKVLRGGQETTMNYDVQ